MEKLGAGMSGGESVSQSSLKVQEFSTFPDQNPRFEQQLEEPTPLPDGAVAPVRRGSHQKYRKQPHAK
jgi:hypothetical protein